MAFFFVKCGLVTALTNVKAGLLADCMIGLFTNDVIFDVDTCDEGEFDEPTWAGYAAQDPNPWGAVTYVDADDLAYVNSALLQFNVDGDPGAEEIQGWFAYDPAAPVGERLRFYEKFAAPVVPEEGTPYLLVVRVKDKTCNE